MSSNNSVVMIDVKAAASIAGRTPETVRRWVWSGRLAAQRDGRRMLVSRDDVLRIRGKRDSEDPSVTLSRWARLPRPRAAAVEATASDLVLLDRLDRLDRENGPAGSAPGE